VETFALTHTGLTRKRNEDRYLVKEFTDGSILLAVADGMGGETAGDYAAEIMIDRLTDVQTGSGDTHLQLSKLVKEADRIIKDEADKNPDLQGMGTTITVTHLRDDSVHWAHVGDSRLYILHNRELIQITKDQNVAQFLVDEGEITVKEARKHPLRNLLDQCVGCAECKPETGYFKINSGDLMILSSDGLHGAVPDETITSLLSGNTDTEAKVRSLIQVALEAGGKDNITVVAAKI